jgi:hypothetical protein
MPDFTKMVRRALAAKTLPVMREPPLPKSGVPSGVPEGFNAEPLFHGSNAPRSSLRSGMSPDDQFPGVSLNDRLDAEGYAQEAAKRRGGAPTVTEAYYRGKLADHRQLFEALGEDKAWDSNAVTDWLRKNGYSGVDYRSDPMLGYGVRIIDPETNLWIKK